MVFGQTTSENYLRTKTYKTETTTPIASPTISQASQSITYFDGLGRPIQQVAHQQSGSGKSIVTPIEYDAFGRQVKEYLPYATNSASLNYVSSALTDVGTFYNTSAYENTTNPFSLKELEASPLNRVLKQAAPGNDWSMASNHVIRFDYQTNTATDAVKLFNVNVTWNVSKGLYDIPTTLTPGNYADFQLYKTVIKDENWKTTDGSNNTTEEFKDKEGRVVLKRTYNNGVKHDTYYIYDQFGNLTFVLPPLVNVTATIASAVLDGLCYQYKYDFRNRLVEKKLPGKQWEFIVYDKLDRVVASGPTMSPFSDPSFINTIGWMITKYDVFNRVVYTGWMPTTFTTTSRSTLQTQYSSATTNFNETKISTTTNTTVNGVAFRYTNVALPTTGYHVLTVNYYDDYNFPNAPTIPTTVEGQTVFYNATLKPKGLPTGTYVRVPETSALYKNETSYILYDEKARPIRNYTTNYLGGFTQVDSKLDWAGKTLYTLTTHKRIALSTVITVKDAFEYTPQDRLLKHTHQINGGTIQLLAKNEYDELGQLIVKRVGGMDLTGTNPLQKVDYNYNIRGWLKGINNSNNLAETTTNNDLFSFKINYNTVQNESGYTGTPLYNGNISETYWRTQNDNVLRKYGYQYDNLNRLTNAIYQKPGASIPVSNSYNESLNYDKNGNIMGLIRNGNIEGATPANVIDNLTYTYDTNIPNRLIKVSDNPTTAISGFRDGTNIGDDFSYDANGNMIVDNNKGITSITYNHLNLPTKITFTSSKTIDYLYNAMGQKVTKIVKNGTTTTTTDYLNDFQYTNAILDFFPHAEGFVNNSLKCVFNYTDHSGNVRLSYSDNDNNNKIINTEILEENNYYPFGLKHNGYNTNVYSNNTGLKYKYNGKELQDELGLNMYDYGARNYDPALGRWMNIDPLAEMSRRFSPYTYALNNSVYFIDPDGMLATPSDWVMRGDRSVYWDNNATSQETTKAGETYLGKETSYTSERGTTVNLHSDKTWNEVLVFAQVGKAETTSDTKQVVTEQNKADMPSKDVKMSVLEPTIPNVLGVVGNVLTVAEQLKNSKVGEFARAGQPASQTISSSLQLTGRVLGGIGIGVTIYQYGTGKISTTEAIMDTTFGVIGFMPGGALVSLGYFGVKAIIEYSTGKTIYDKPVKK